MSKQKKVLIFSCGGGGCHISVHKALQAYLSDDYQVVVVDYIRTVINGLDPILFLSRGKYASDTTYNFFVAHKLTRRFTPELSRILLWSMGLIWPALQKKTRAYLQQEKPDLVISIIPIFNGVIAQAAHETGAAFALIPLDLDARVLFFYDLELHNVYGGYCLLPFDDEVLGHQSRSQLPFESQHAFVCGFPLRPEFFEQKNKEKIKTEFLIPHDKPVILVIMGGAGSDNMFTFYQQLLTLETPMHIILCLGRNERLRKKLEQLSRPACTSVSILGYTPYISDLMAVAQVIITKPGPGSICEALYLNVPILVDDTPGTIYWEKFHVEFVEKNRFGDVIRKAQELPQLLMRYLHDPVYYQEIKRNQQQFEKKAFNTMIKKLVADMVS